MGQRVVSGRKALKTSGRMLGGFSIEPYLAVVYHDDSLTSPDEIR